MIHIAFVVTLNNCLNARSSDTSWSWENWWSWSSGFCCLRIPWPYACCCSWLPSVCKLACAASAEAAGIARSCMCSWSRMCACIFVCDWICLAPVHVPNSDLQLITVNSIPSIQCKLSQDWSKCSRDIIKIRVVAIGSDTHISCNYQLIYSAMANYN